MNKKAVIAILSLACCLGFTVADSHANSFTNGLKKAEHTVAKDFKKVGSSLKKGTHKTGSTIKKDTKKITPHKK